MTTTSHPAVPQPPGFRDMLLEAIPLAEVVPVDGPPLLFLLAPWVFLALMLAGPFACLVVIVVAMIVAAAAVAAVVAAVVGVVAAPYLLAGRVRRYLKRRGASSDASAAHVVAIGSPRVAA